MEEAAGGAKSGLTGGRASNGGLAGRRASTEGVPGGGASSGGVTCGRASTGKVTGGGDAMSSGFMKGHDVPPVSRCKLDPIITCFDTRSA